MQCHGVHLEFGGADPKRMCPTRAWNTQTYWFAKKIHLDQYREITVFAQTWPTKYHQISLDRGTVSKDSATGSSVPILSKWCPKTLLPSTSAVMWLWVTRKRNIPGSLHESGTPGCSSRWMCKSYNDKTQITQLVFMDVYCRYAMHDISIEIYRTHTYNHGAPPCTLYMDLVSCKINMY